MADAKEASRPMALFDMSRKSVVEQLLKAGRSPRLLGHEQAATDDEPSAALQAQMKDIDQ